MPKNKLVTINFVHDDTGLQFFKSGPSYCIAFDFDKNSKKKMIGIGISKAAHAKNLKKYFAMMEKALRRDGK